MPVTRGDDGIAVLPDEVLQHLLSFLPLQEAVRTSMLARRWRHLWKSMPVLWVTGDGRTLDRRGVRKLNKFVNHLLLLRDRIAPVHQFQIELGTFRSQVEPQINLWIRHALLCQARILGVHLARYNNSFELDDLPVISQHLRKLDFCNVVLRDNFLNFSSSPALEELWMTNCSIEADIISSKSLKQLTIINCSFCSDALVQICIPTLITLVLTDCLGNTPLLESMPSLVSAHIKLADYSDDYCSKEKFPGICFSYFCSHGHGNRTTDCVLLKGLSAAKSLELIAVPREFIFKMDLMWCPTFSKLKYLFLNEWCVALGLHALVCFLQHTPVLERLTLQISEAHDDWKEQKRNYNVTEQSFASKQLKVVEVKYEKFDRRVHKVLRLLIIYGIYIEDINIQRIDAQRSMRSSKEVTDIPHDSGAGRSGAQTQYLLPLEDGLMANTINCIIAQQQQILAQKQHFLAVQQQLLTHQEVLGQYQRRWQALDQILTQLSDYCASYS